MRDDIWLVFCADAHSIFNSAPQPYTCCTTMHTVCNLRRTHMANVQSVLEYVLLSYALYIYEFMCTST